MFACTINDGSVNESEYMTLEDYKLEYTDVILHLNTLQSHGKLLDYQKKPKFKVTNKNGKEYLYKFNLTLKDTNMGECLMMQKDFKNIKTNTIYLFVCTALCDESNKLLQTPKDIYEVKESNIFLHFLSSPHNVDFIGKHKGIVQQLNTNHLLLFAGEIYKTEVSLIYNLQSGTLRKNMFKNNENLCYNKTAGIPKKANADTFHDVIALPVLKKLTKDNLILDNKLRNNYGIPVTHNHIKELLKLHPHLEYNKTTV
jgi:hypothetical protein